jgi:hypothetical protein
MYAHVNKLIIFKKKPNTYGARQSGWRLIALSFNHQWLPYLATFVILSFWQQ